MVSNLHYSNCPRVLDFLSAPMFGYNARIICMKLHMRSSHMRNFNSDLYSVEDKVIVMINPEISAEPHAEASLQYEYHFLEGTNCKHARLV